MPGQKRKYNVRFPPGRVKKIMQKDTEVGRIATAVPVIISKALEMFLRYLLTTTCKITQSRNSRVMSISHMKQCIHSEKLFDFLKDVAEQASECKPNAKWQSHRKLWQSVSYKDKSSVKEEQAQEAHDLLIDSGSSSRNCTDVNISQPQSVVALMLHIMLKDSFEILHALSILGVRAVHLFRNPFSMTDPWQSLSGSNNLSR